MSNTFDPTPRPALQPALRKAADADIHPTTGRSISTADSVLEGKKVPLVVRVPKKLRKQARELARQSDTNLDEIVATALAAEVRRRSG
jgi:hypothetical protein